MILSIAIPTPLRRIFDYLPPKNGEIPAAGVRVKVPFGNRQMVGLVLGSREESDQPTEKLKSVDEVLDEKPLLPQGLQELVLWAAGYYQHPIGDALFTALPVLLRKGEAVPDNRREHWQLSTRGLGLGDASLKRAKKQRELIDILQQGPLATTELTDRGFTRQIIRALADKQLIEATLLAEGNATPTGTNAPLLTEQPLALRAEQQRVLEQIEFDRFCPTLIFGDTGTGKTEVYLQAIEKVLEQGRQALVLIPEINLTPQTLGRFRRRFNCPVRGIHSGLTDRERLQVWADAREGRASIIIGTRSAVFTPMARPGIIVVDEEHDLSFKQQEGFRYSARDVAVMRASKSGIPILLGSATPSLESLLNCQNRRYQLAKLEQRQQLKPPAWTLVDLRGSALQGGLAAESINAMRDHLSRGNQVLVFLNRRGYAPVMLCHDCGWQALCRHCSAKQTVHLQSNRLICHHCEWQTPIPRHCPACHSPNLQFSGQGTERCEETLDLLFPHTPVLRVDRDSTRRKGAMEKVLNDINAGEPCILVGTQMLAKGHHFPSVTLAILVDVDGGLFSTDFRAVEKTAQMITQVAGRAGRGDVAGEIYLQSHYCDHPVISDITAGNYGSFAANALRERKLQQLPPYTYLALFRADARQPQQGEQFLQALRRRAEGFLPPSISVNYLGPLPGAMEKQRGQFRFTLLINAVNRTELSTGLTQLCESLDSKIPPGNVKWSLDIDPQDMT